jgi:hypothetical protein
MIILLTYPGRCPRRSAQLFANLHNPGNIDTLI